jgi:hypothetical protein
VQLRHIVDAIGMDYKSAIDRFAGNEAVLVKLLKKLANDTSYNNLVSAMKARDTEKIALYSHSIKGLAANFSLNPLYHAASALNAAAKEGREADYDTLYDVLRIEYEKVAAAIALLD